LARAPVIVAHRGLHDGYPENSLSAFRAAWTSGIEWCECDIHLTADGIPVILHDETLDRTTTGKGAVRDATLDELDRLVRLRDSDGDLTKARVATLAQVLRAMSFCSRLLVEVKAGGAKPAERVVDVIKTEGAEGRCVVQSFMEEHLRVVSGIEPPLPVAWLVDRPEQLADAYRATWPRINARFDLLDELTIRPLRNGSKSVGAWTVNKVRDIQRMLRLGIDTMITDEPRIVQQVADAS
jgi:glycerophosphoryl diester phosphodiesterase